VFSGSLARTAPPIAVNSRALFGMKNSSLPSADDRRGQGPDQPEGREADPDEVDHERATEVEQDDPLTPPALVQRLAQR
jgi:hypothetical protein